MPCRRPRRTPGIAPIRPKRWQRRFWEHAIRDDADYAAHVDYEHFNPVKHGLVDEPAGWPHSTFKACVARGLYPPDWAGAGLSDIQAGEPSR